MNFTSDNCYGASPQILDAVAAANAGCVPSYGEDAITARLQKSFSDLFERDVAAYPVISGTAANALALSALVPPHGAIFCHAQSHVSVDECGAVEFFTHGAKLWALEGAPGRLDPGAVEAALAPIQRDSVHHAQPAALSITQATEFGTLYSAAEISGLAGLAHRQGMKVHMDGARFANAVAALGCAPANITWRAGVDVLSFGAAKNGALGAEAVVFFDPDLAGDFAFRRKKSGHLISKMRFVSAQLEAYLANGHWLDNARRANRLAARLADGLRGVAGVEIVHRVEANIVFATVPDELAARLRRAGATFYDWTPSKRGRTLIRLVTSFATPEEDVANFIDAAKS